MPRPLPRWTGTGALVGASPFHTGLPRNAGGSASITSLSRPARASLTLRPAGLLNRPRRPLSRGFDPAGCPTVSLVSYQSLPTPLWVVPSSTGEPRRRGAPHYPGYLLGGALSAPRAVNDQTRRWLKSCFPGLVAHSLRTLLPLGWGDAAELHLQNSLTASYNAPSDWT